MTCTSWLLYLCSIIFATTYGTAFFPSSSASGESNSRVCPVDSDMSGLISSTALDFQEMMRKERALVLKNQGEKAVADLAGRDASSRMRYLSKRRPRLDLHRNHRVENNEVDGIYYVPEFVTAEEGKRLQAAAREREGRGAEWKDLFKRRLQIHGGTPHPSGMVEDELPGFLREVCAALVEAGVFEESSPPNHVLLNEYSEGQGIGPHKDGPLYEGRVAILSLGKEAFLDFWRSLEDAKADCSEAEMAAAAVPSAAAVADARVSDVKQSASTRAVASVQCQDCSLVVFEGQAYYDLWHGIASTVTTTTRGVVGDASGLNQINGERGSVSCSNRSDVMGDNSIRREDGALRNQEGRHDCRAIPGAVSAGGHENGDRGAGGADDRSGRSSANKRLSFTIRRVAKIVSADSVVEHAEARSERERRRKFFERSVTETGVSVPPLINADTG